MYFLFNKKSVIQIDENWEIYVYVILKMLQLHSQLLETFQVLLWQYEDHPHPYLWQLIVETGSRKMIYDVATIS